MADNALRKGLCEYQLGNWPPCRNKATRGKFCGMHDGTFGKGKFSCGCRRGQGQFKFCPYCGKPIITRVPSYKPKGCKICGKKTPIANERSSRYCEEHKAVKEKIKIKAQIDRLQDKLAKLNSSPS